MEFMLRDSMCPICGSGKFRNSKVLWPELVEAWELNAEETAYIDRQQGLACESCGNNLRSMVLAKSILTRLGETKTLQQIAGRFRYRNLRILEINEAGNLTPFLQVFPRHELVSYPDSDMTKLDFKDDTWDLVIHSETLEHVPEPVAGIKECRRILRRGGACIFTIPIIVGRMTRSREGLKDSYHGDPKIASPDYKVVTEFGADAWTFVISAGFDSCRIHVMDYPAGIAIEAIK
jgi:SAM-dependent methyltransferase